MKILVNQQGYETGRAARAVLQTVDGTDPVGSLVLRDAEGRAVARYDAGPVETVPGWADRRFRTLVFTPPEGGPWVLEAAAGDVRSVSAPFIAGRNAEAAGIVSDILSGITAGRSVGVSDRSDRDVPFFGSRPGTVDVHGGWYDASGDTSKYLSHLSYANYMNPQQTPLVVWTLLDARDRLEAGEFPLEERLNLRLKEEAVWGADFLMRMQDAEGYFYTTVFDVWSKDLDSRRICSYRTQNGVLSDDYQAGYRQGGGMAIAALARSARIPGAQLGDYSVSDYRDAAFRGWQHLEEHNPRYLDDGTENIIDDTCALLAAVELSEAGVDRVRESAERRAGSLIARWDDVSGCFRADAEGHWSWFHASDEALPLVALIRAVRSNTLDGGIRADVEHVVTRAMAAELRRASAVPNPFRHPRRLVRMPGREDSEQFFYPHDNPSGYWWQGENARLASWSAAARAYLDAGFSETSEGLIDPDDLASFADAQISWILGLNPFDACMLQGHGRNNPPYEWDHFNLPGGVANGITSGFTDESDIAFMPPDAMRSGDHSWRWGEQWIPHAAWLLLAAAWA